MKKISISRMTIICLFIFLLSICGTVVCIIRMNAYYHSRSLAYLSEDDLESGRYVSGTITSYVVSPCQPKVPYDGYFGNYHDVLTNEEYVGYLIPFNKEQYIRIWVKEQESLALLRESQDGLHVNVPFTGKIEEWDTVQSIYSDDTLGFDHNKVITDYVIFQRNLNTEKFFLKVCLFGIVISLLLYYFKGRVEVEAVEAVHENKNPLRTANISRYADISTEIEIVEQRIRMYGQLEKKYRKWGCIGVVCIGAGVFLFVKFVSFSALVSLILLTGYGINKLWRYFINSENGFAEWIAKLFDIRTLQMKRMEDYVLLAALQNKEDT